MVVVVGKDRGCGGVFRLWVTKIQVVVGQLALRETRGSVEMAARWRALCLKWMTADGLPQPRSDSSQWQWQ